MDVEITELELIDADRVDGVGMPANGIGILMMKQVADPVAKDWAEWDADHGGSGKGGKAGDSKASAADAVARAKQTIADHKAGKKVSAADLKNAHDVHEAHLAHEAKLKADAKPAAKKDVAKGARDCPKCDKSYDADHTGAKCENCGTDLPDAPAAKAADQVDCPTCKGDGKIMGDKRDCPDCENGKVTPAKAKTLAAKALVKAIVGRKVDETPDIAGGTAVLAQIADLIIGEAQELKSGQAGEISDIMQLAMAAEMIWCWRTGEEAVASGSVQPATALMQSAAVAKDRDYSDGERKEMAADGRALPDGSYPINDEHDLNSAAILARSGHGDVTAATKHIGKRAKELGVKNPLDDTGGTSKSQIAPEETTVDTVTQTGDLTEVVKAAVAKANASLVKEIADLKAARDLDRAELAKVKATPVPGGPVLSRNVQVKTPGGVQDTDKAAKAALMRQKAEMATTPGDREGYLAYARELDEEARKALPSA
jgi:hypothetical protein